MSTQPETTELNLYDNRGQAVRLYVVEGGRVARPATTYEQEQWTRADTLKANSPGIVGGAVLFFCVMGFAYRFAKWCGVNGAWGPLAVCAGCLGMWYVLQVRKERRLAR